MLTPRIAQILVRVIARVNERYTFQHFDLKSGYAIEITDNLIHYSDVKDIMKILDRVNEKYNVHLRFYIGAEMTNYARPTLNIIGDTRA